MITLSKSGSTVTFTFDENSGYLQNGTIDVPVNSLSLVIDDSDMATFRKSASNDIFVSARYADFGMTKAELEAWYKANMVGSTGGGGGGTVSSAVTSGDTNAVAGGAVYDQVTIGGGMEVISSVTISSPYSYVVMPDCDKFTISAGTAVGDDLTSGGKVINVYDKSTDTFVFSSNTVSNMSSNYVTVEGTTADTSITLTAVDGYYFKGDNSMTFKSNYSGGWVVTFYKNADAEWLKNVVSANTIAIEGKQDTLIEGRAIDITNNTVSLDLPISADTGAYSIAEGRWTAASGGYSHAEGYSSGALGDYSHAEGYQTFARGSYSHTEGYNTEAKNDYEHVSGQFNNSVSATTTFGDSGNTLFSVGNGDAFHKHNTLDIRQNGDIYIADTSGSGEYYQKPMIKLQDALGGGATYTAGNGINIDTANTISLGVAISAGTGTNSIVEGHTNNKASGQYSHAEGYNTKANGNYSHAEGYDTTAKTSYSHAEGRYTIASGEQSHAEGFSTTANTAYSHAEGCNTKANGFFSHAEGYYTEAKNDYEHASGRYNVSRTGNTDADRTLFTVGNGTNTGESASNAFEIRQNGDIYLTKDGQDVKLQDQLGGGVTVDSALSITSENPVQNKVLFGELRAVDGKDPDTVITWNDYESTNFPSGCTSIVVNVPNFGDQAYISFSDTNNHSLGYYDIRNMGDIRVSNMFDDSTYTTSGTSVTIIWDSLKNVAKLSDDVIGSSPSVTAIGATTYISVKNSLGGFKLLQITQSDYDALNPNYDANTLYIIVN